MAVRKLSKEGRFEAGFDSFIAGKHWAFIPALNKNPGPPFVLGIAAANEPGYWPIPVNWAHADSYDEMADHADELNEAEGISKDEASRVHISSMAASERAKPKPPSVKIKIVSENVSGDEELLEALRRIVDDYEEGEVVGSFELDSGEPVEWAINPKEGD